MIPDFRKVKVNLLCKGAAKVSALLLVGLCAFGIVPWNEAAAVCYAKADTDKEKVEEFVTAYYEAHTAEGIETLPDYVEDAKSAAEEMMVLEVCLELGVEKYDNLDVTAYPLGDGIRWLVVVSYELIVEDFDIGIPGLTTLTVRKQKGGAFKIYDEYLDDIDDTEREKLEEEIWELALSDEIYDKTNDINAGYNTVVSENPDILAWVLDLQDGITQAYVDRMEDSYEPKTAAAPGTETEAETKTRETYIVRAGDCLWTIAEEQLGDGMYWSSIYEVNRELIGDDPNLIYVGWELILDVNAASAAINDFDESEMQEKEDTEAYPIETIYTDEECKEITIGNISCDVRKFYHVAKIVEEENKITFFAETDSKPNEPGFDGPQQITYIVSKEPELSDSYEDAIKYFEGIREFRGFESYQTADDNTIRALHKAVGRGEDKAYYLVGVSEEDGLYFIETEDILLDNHLQVQYGRDNPFVEEYCCTVSDVKCGWDYTYTAQVEKKIYYEEMHAEYKVTSERLNYSAEFSAVPSEDDESKLVNTLNVTLEDDQYKVPAVQWVSDGLTRSDYPEFRDMNADGYLDLLCYAYTPDSSSRSMEIIFVWDEREDEYVQVSKIGGPEEYGWSDTFESPYESDGQGRLVEEWHYEYEGDTRKAREYIYQWEDNQLSLMIESESEYTFDAEIGTYVDPNPYAQWTETFSGGYLYDIYEAGKESVADGDWFVDDSGCFTYYEVYDPLNDEHLSAEWEIELAEMKGTDRLAQAVNEYHAELFEEQKEWMQEKQDTVMAMDIEEYRTGKMGRGDSHNIRTKASFEWGNVFTIVDMENTSDRRCCPVIANFNKTTGEKYEFSDLFNTDDYNAKLLERIRHRYDGREGVLSIDLESGYFSFMITSQGLFVINDYPGRSMLFEWIELEDILNREVCSELGLDIGWKELAPDEVISYDFFFNANQWHYNLNDEVLAAEVICAYVGDDIEEGTWELRDIHIRDTDNGRILKFVACAEDGTRELYMLLDETRETGPQYLVMADVKVSKYGDVAYDSDLHWEAYQDRTDFPEKYSAYSIYADRDAHIYESVYLDESINAMADYLACVQADKDTEWWLLGDSIFIDENGLLVDVCFSDGFQRVHMMVDRNFHNRQYSIVEVYDAQDAKDFSAESADDAQTNRNDLYDIKGTEANFFENAYRFRYNPQIFKAAACAVKDYAEKIDFADEEWELIRIYSEDGTVGVIARTTSLGRRLSLLIKGDTYQVVADVQKGDGGESELSDGFSYDSEMKWHSYYEWTINGEKENESVYTVRCNEEYYRHDSIYDYQLHRAMQEYLSSINANQEEEWEMLPEKLFVGCHGSLADAWYTNGNRRVHLVVDVWNKVYAVIVGEDK